MKTGLHRAMGTATAALPIWLTALLLLALSTVAGLIVSENYNNALKEGEARAVSSAHVVAAHMEWMMEASDLALRRIEASLGTRPVEASAQLVEDLSRAVGELPAGFEYALLDQMGTMRFSSNASSTLPDHSARLYFSRLKEGEELTFSRLADEDGIGRPSFIIARRIGRGVDFRGVASITIPNENLDRFWASMDLGPNSTIAVLRDDGWLVARRPVARQAVDLSQTEWFPLTRKQTSGFYHSSVSPIDGLSRIVAFWKVQGWPLIALAAVERQEVLDQFWRNLFSDALLMVPLMAVLVLAAIWINRLLYRTAVRNEELEQALERNRFLLREIHHRVKNNLQAVLALVRLQQLPSEAREDMSRRISAMIAVHEQIYETDQFERVEVAPYITKLVHDIASGYDAAVQIHLELQPLTVDRDQALPIGMIVNEVVSNSFKYAFAGRSTGTLSVSLREEDNVLHLVVRDDGPGIGPSLRPRGMGTKLITNFVRQLGGRSSLQNDEGAVFSLTVPLEVASQPAD
ncbi:hypothetical protein E2F50_14400 [Rhizobium deserti]|uniref:histidine kinase n=1 Tax=Rhizobium deserti TaxID=2547961 RepID=A0A4R5UHT8_9HYPH|nr:histidine kinase dimerization/phosphoacceptor domain -containing protein [Rhizobium deserti]TDK35432.1 hypothetical protein E2F50_14400 [Rhizobium deserti]